MPLIEFKFKNPTDPEDNTFIDATTVKLSSSDTAYGVKRNDTDAVVVADDTDMNNVGTGCYEYNFQEPAFNLTYTYSVEAIYNSVTYYFVYDNFKGTFVQTNKLYATVAEWKTFADYTGNGYTDTDAQITGYLELASQMIDDYCHQNFYDNYHYNEIPTIIHQVCMVIASRVRSDPTNNDTNAVSETIGRYSYSGNSNQQSDVGGLIPSEYNRLNSYRKIKNV
jgi:hypothetical protein